MNNIKRDMRNSAITGASSEKFIVYVTEMQTYSIEVDSENEITVGEEVNELLSDPDWKERVSAIFEYSGVEVEIEYYE